MRPNWDTYFLKIAYAVAERSTCERAHVGAVIVKEKRILTTGLMDRHQDCHTVMMLDT